MRLHFLGHASFLLTSASGRRVLLDPCRPGALGGKIRTAQLASPPDAIAVTHYHEDHGWTGAVPGAAPVVDASTTLFGIRFRAVTAPHDGQSGSRMGLTRSFVITVDGLRVLHVGDLGEFDDEWLRAVGPVHLALVPAGGVYTLAPDRAAELAVRTRADWVIPMHYRTSDVDLPIAERGPFVDAMAQRGVASRPASNPAQLSRVGAERLPRGVLLMDALPSDTRLA